MFDRIAIIGVGLIGGSVGLCCRESGLAGEVAGIGRDEGRLGLAVRLGAIDSYFLSVEEGVPNADLVIIATPAAFIERMARKIESLVTPGTIIIDVGSVKGDLPALLDSIFSPSSFFVGCHPVAGKERSGVEAADKNLFRGTKTIITPTGRTEPDALAKVRRFWEHAGSNILTIDPYRHDRIFSIISHLPHMIAFSLVNQVEDMKGEEPDILDFSGGGLRDYVRLGGSSPEMWRDIALLNRENLVKAIKEYIHTLNRLVPLVDSEDSKGMEEFFRRSNSAWREI